MIIRSYELFRTKRLFLILFLFKFQNIKIGRATMLEQVNVKGKIVEASFLHSAIFLQHLKQIKRTFPTCLFVVQFAAATEYRRIATARGVEICCTVLSGRESFFLFILNFKKMVD